MLLLCLRIDSIGYNMAGAFVYCCCKYPDVSQLSDTCHCGQGALSFKILCSAQGSRALWDVLFCLAVTHYIALKR